MIEDCGSERVKVIVLCYFYKHEIIGNSRETESY